MNDMGRAVAAAEARGLRLSGEQRNALEHVIRRPRLSLVVGLAGTGKSAMLGVAREAWESAGYTVRGAALSGIAARSEEHTSELQSLMRISYAVFFLKKKKNSADVSEYSVCPETP